MAHTPVVIIGAPRSGTNMLRDLLCSVDGVATWPCDEINYIWRHGNLRYPSDAFSPDMVNPRIQQYIRGQFSWVAKKYGARIVVEKTCANSLRVDFVERVLSQPKYIFIARDGVDVVCSAMRRWRAKLDLPYVLRKVVERILRYLDQWDPQPDTLTPAGPDPPLPQGETLPLTYHPVPDIA